MKLSQNRIKTISAVLIIGVFILACFTNGTLAFTRLENLLLPFVVLALAMQSRILLHVKTLIPIILFIVLSSLSIFINELEASFIMLAIRFIKYAILFCLSCLVIGSRLKILDIVIKTSLIIIAIITVIEGFNPFGWGDAIHSWLTNRPLHEFEVYGARRLLGVMQNPNDNALLLLCFSGYFLSSFYYFKKKLDLVFVALCLLFIITSQSRTTLVAIGVMYVVFIFQYRVNRKLILGGISVIALSCVIVYFLKLEYIVELVTKNPLDVPAFRGRYPAWSFMMDQWQSHKILGAGPLAHKMDAHRNAPDSEYIYVLASYGIAGLIAYLGMLIGPILIWWRRRKEVEHALVAVLIPVGFIFIGVTNFTIFNVQIAMMFYIILGLPYYFCMKKESADLKGFINFKGIFKEKKEPVT